MTPLPSHWKILSTLVGCPSVSATLPEYDLSNETICIQLANWLTDMGARVEYQVVSETPKKINLIAKIGPDHEQAGLILSGHSDTVPTNPERWTSDPFVLTERGDEWFGLGTCDMKGFFVSALHAMQWAVNNLTLEKPIVLLATADEETSMAGVRHLQTLINNLNQTPVLVGEPTSLRPVSLHKGIMMHRVELLGQAGHSSNPAYGHNALEAMHQVTGELLAIREEWQARFHDPRFDVPTATLNLGCVHGGDNPNRICGWCDLEHDVRLIPGMEPTELFQTLRHRLPKAITDQAIKLNLTPLTEPVPPFDNADSTFIERLESLCQQKAISVNYTTEAPFFQAMGGDVVVCGPGDIAWAHQPEERVSPQALQDMQMLLQTLIQQECTRT